MARTKLSSEVVAEAQDIIDALNRDLIAADSERASGAVKPERINTLFRSAHSLKGISGMFGLDELSRLAHELETLLDAMRLGKVECTPNALDALFGCVDVFGALLQHAAAGEDVPEGFIEGSIRAIHEVANGPAAAPSGDILSTVDVSDDILSVLTEYEEHRLKENIKQGRNLFLLGATFELSNFDVGLAVLDEAVGQLGEVITKLPSARDSEPGAICFDILVGCDTDLDSLTVAVGDERIDIKALQRRQNYDPNALTQETESPTENDSEPEKATPAEETATLKSVSQTVRVDIRRLDRLMNLVGELALTKLAFQRLSDLVKKEYGFTGVAVELHKESRNFERRLTELQSGIMDVRMIPLTNLFERMVRAGRKLSRELKKPVHIEVSGETTELDKLIVEDLADPLMHLIRNAIDHGIEPPEERVAKGKPDTGKVVLAASAQGNQVVVEVSDDGHGLDEKKILKRALERGLVSEDQVEEMASTDVFNLIFTAGFSTRDQVSEVSGRGVGMDVVKTNIAALSGVTDIDSTFGQGTTITVTLPITLAIIPALVVKVADETYAIPLNNVQETLVVRDDVIETIERREVVSVRGATVPLIDLRSIFSITDAHRPDLTFAVIAGVGRSRMALQVDELIGQQDIVIKSLGKRMQNIPGIAGATELGNQQTILVIDIVDILNETGADSIRGEVA